MKAVEFFCYDKFKEWRLATSPGRGVIENEH
jgi:hypothetical protein